MRGGPQRHSKIDNSLHNEIISFFKFNNLAYGSMVNGHFPVLFKGKYRGRTRREDMTLSCKPKREKGGTGVMTSRILQKWTFSALSAFSEKQGKFPTKRMLSFQFFLFRA